MYKNSNHDKLSHKSFANISLVSSMYLLILSGIPATNLSRHDGSMLDQANFNEDLALPGSLIEVTHQASVRELPTDSRLSSSLENNMVILLLARNFMCPTTFLSNFGPVRWSRFVLILR